MIVFVDIETTGLDPQRHTIFEIALITPDFERTYWLKMTPDELGAADSMALQINRYYNRRAGHTINDPALSAQEIAKLTAHSVLAGNNVKFDQQFLDVWMRKHGAAPAWNYHVLDVPTFAAGYLLREAVKLEPPFKSSKVSRAFDVPEPAGDNAHTAMADAQWSKAMYDACLADAKKPL